MKGIRKWLVRIGIILLAILIILASAGVWFVRRPWPQVRGTIRVSGLQAPVEVIRDQWEVPNIYAENEHDLFFAQGYVHAQDRLWQMEVYRRAASGTASEIYGEDAIGEDRLVRTIGLRRIAEQSWLELDDDTRAILEAYAEGVNAYIESHRNRLPLEFTILDVTPAPWTPIDSLVWSNLMAFYMGWNYSSELRHAIFARTYGADVLELYPPQSEDLPVTVPSTDDTREMQDTYLESTAVSLEWLSNPDTIWASNNWVVSGSRTETGKPILANDTHMRLSMPSPWYENGLHGGRFDTTGFTFPGVPLVLIGHNQRIAWGITNLDADVQDLYLEDVDSLAHPQKYQFEGEWQDIEVVHETIAVKGESPVELNIYLTRHGPLINAAIESANYIGPMALQWNLYDGSMVLESLALLNQATNWEEFRNALQYWDTLSQNFVYADADGNIGYQAAGKIPIRATGHTGVVPVQGWTGEYEWQGFIPFEELPSLFNPPTGFIATANNKPVSDDYPYRLNNDVYHHAYRAMRIDDLLAASDHFTIEDMYAIQNDTYSIPAEILRPYLLAAVEPEDELQSEALARVQSWDLRYDVDSIGATVFELWYRFMVRNTFGDELRRNAGLERAYEGDIERNTPMLIAVIPDADNAWFNDASTGRQVEARDDIVRRSWTDAVNWLHENRGDHPANWEWGQLHTQFSVHELGGSDGDDFADRLFNGPVIESPGHSFTVNSIVYEAYSPPGQPMVFVSHFGTSQRLVVDLSNWDMAAINSTGQSGQLFHPHREDQISMWRSGEYHMSPFSREAVEANGKDVLWLRPQ